MWAVALAGEAAAPAGVGGIFGALMPLMLIFVIFYFLLILPQRKKQKAHAEMVKNLKNGDKVITTGGIYGTVTKIKKDNVEIEIASQIKVKVQRSCISQLRREK
jgi:preprotein translocase subunit YajC